MTSFLNGNPMQKNADGTFSVLNGVELGSDFVRTGITNVTPQYATLYDDFLLGPFGWSVFSLGAPTGQANYIQDIADPNHQGINRIDTGNVSGAGMAWWNGNFGPGAGYPNWILEGLVQTSSLTSGIAFGFFGSSTFGTQDALHFIYDSNIGANWQVQSPKPAQYDTGVAAQANTWTKLTMRSDGTNVYCYINGVLVKTLNIANEPLAASASRIGFFALTRAAAHVLADVDYIVYSRGPLTR